LVDYKLKLLPFQKIDSQMKMILKMSPMLLTSRREVLTQVIKDCKEMKYNDAFFVTDTHFIPERCPSCITLSNNNKVLSWTGQSYCSIFGTVSDEFTIHIIKGCTNLMVGFAKNSINMNTHCFRTNGFFLYAQTGTLYSESGEEGKKYAVPCSLIGDRIRCINQNGDISYSINNNEYPVAYKSKGIKLHPAITWGNTGVPSELKLDN